MKEHLAHAKDHLTIKELPVADRPREKLLEKGARNLTEAELLAIIIGMGPEGETAISLAQRLLKQLGKLAEVARADAAELQGVRGIGPAKACQILAAVELGRRCEFESGIRGTRLNSPAAVVERFKLKIGDSTSEQMLVAILDTKNQVIMEELYKGSANSSPVRIAELFKTAVRKGAMAVILAHNHPSGDPTPSPEDIEVTRQAVEAGRLLNIDVLDHVIVAGNKHLSFRERKLVFDH
ncbi:MAG: DNA repair protein RadC [Chloroflexi bacterium]|nr:DNA repair protein RadC [Chloroflexota bacterium]